MKAVGSTAAIGALLTLLGGSLCHRIPEPEGLFAEAESLRQRCEKHASLAAIARYREAQGIWAGRGDRRRAARTCERIGTTYAELGAPREAIRAYETALALGTADQRLESEVHTGLGLSLSLVAEGVSAFEDASRHCAAALDLARRAQDGSTQARAWNCLGEVAYGRQQPEQALAFHRRADQIYEQLADPRGRAETLRLMGAVYSDLSELDAADDCYRRALALPTSPDDKRGRAIALILEARLKARRGELQQALNGFESALGLAERTGDAVWEASALTGIATLLRDMGRADQSVRRWERALQLFESSGLRTVTVDVLMSLGEAHLALGRDAAALREFERARDLADELQLPRWKAHALRYIGVIHVFRQRPDDARCYLASSLKEQQAFDDDRLRARTLADVGDADLLQRKPAQAAEAFSRALAIAKSAGDPVAKARASFGLARSSSELGALDRAREHVAQTLTIVESLRTEVDNRDLQMSYAASTYHFHEFQMDVLMRLHQRRPSQGLAAAALEACERARARSLLDSLADAGVDLRKSVDPELVRRDEALKRAFADWAERQGRAGRSAAAALAEEYHGLEEQYDQLQALIRSRSPRYTALARPRPLDLREIQERVLDADTLLLEYALGEERSYVWAVSTAGSASAVLPGRVRIEALARRVHERLTARLRVTGTAAERRRAVEEADVAYWKEAAELSAVILGPVARSLAGKRLLVVADGALQHVPFAALPLPGVGHSRVPLAAEHQVVGLPSASVLAILREEAEHRASPHGTVAVLADPVFERDDPRLPAAGAAVAVPVDAGHQFPRLAASRQEAAGILSLVPREAGLLATGPRASRATATSRELARYRIVHFATHGVFDDSRPERSGIVLSFFDENGRSRDGFLRLHDVYELELPVDLVVLSACDSALGREMRGEGLVGMVRGFMYAGARRVVASLWKVDDEATGELMRVFYRGMLREGRTPADALRQAQLALCRSRRWSAPFYWSAFVLQGEPG